MRQSFLRVALIGALMAGAPAWAGSAAPGHAADPSLATALASPLRSPANSARDLYRHPAETLAFFGVDPTDTVVELWPGGGWYTEVLAPYLAERGKLWVAPPAGRSAEAIAAKLAGNAAYAKVGTAPVTVGEASEVPAGSADVVLTFRNVHNWLMGNPPIADAVFAEAFRMLKPGGTLGVVEHRLPEAADSARQESSGYIKTSTVRALAEKAGFRFVEASEINANAKDTADWPKGVWTLPPTYSLKDVDRAKYQAIGESDRMTLKFVKPE